ncbi:adiponectin receptor protein 2-like isoform X2 [Rhinatrema bivittatum]|uniref:adiponectin receptor protein 2-like isoform X2 n=1 Tax=Rhinatrema bivittatum TaxID=194408 RepID=UPI00112C7224|nr:adiponectin receptor protein 2-like isoform X2 [Rhinatrema bivittatum]
MPTSDSSAAVREHPDSQTPSSAEKPEEEPTKVTSRISLWRGSWQALSHARLPDWLQDNDFLLRGHRPPLFSFRACFRSIFRLHTETWNIWTHLIGQNGPWRVLLRGCPLHVLLLALPYLLLPFPTGGSYLIQAGLLWHCNPHYGKLHPLALLHLLLLPAATHHLPCGHLYPRGHYYHHHAVGTVLQARVQNLPPVFLGLGLCGVIPTLHITILEGFLKASTYGQTEWLIVMALLYILGAAFYTARIPERFFPGWCDIWFHSHQIFHVLVILGALVHLYSIWRLQVLRASRGGCESDFFT